MARRKTARTNRHRDGATPPAVICRSAPLSTLELRLENAEYRDTGGISPNNRESGFRPAYRNIRTGQTVMSCFANGEQAPVHVLDGVPEEWVVARDGEGRVSSVVATVVSGFVRNGHFFTREAAAILMSSEEVV